jgi:AcrR family transcriptional regulator
MQAAAEVHESPVRLRILEAARGRFETFGYRRTGIAEIAREAGVAPGTLYRYFKNKEDIFLEALRELNDSWVERARRALSEPGNAAERLARLAPLSIEFYSENSLLTSVLARDTDIIFAPLLGEVRERLLEQNVEMMAEVIRDGIREGTFREVDPERAAYALFVSGQAMFNESHFAYEDALPTFANIVMQGLLRR